MFIKLNYSNKYISKWAGTLTAVSCTFPRATNCDVVALMACVHLGDPDFAVHCANNRGMSIILLAIDELHKKLGPDFDLLDQRTLVGAAVRTPNDLEEHLAKRDVFANIGWPNETPA